MCAAAVPEPPPALDPDAFEEIIDAPTRALAESASLKRLFAEEAPDPALPAGLSYTVFSTVVVVQAKVIVDVMAITPKAVVFMCPPRALATFRPACGGTAPRREKDARTAAASRFQTHLVAAFFGRVQR
jgi:hypothetical protein